MSQRLLLCGKADGLLTWYSDPKIQKRSLAHESE